MATVKANLIAAKALIDTPRKWIKGDFEENGCLCAVGAIGMACSGEPTKWRPLEWQALVAALPKSIAKSVSAFNDDPATTHADIMALFDRAIAAQDV